MTTTTNTAFPTIFDDSWRGFGGIHGGLVVAALLRGAAGALDATPIAVTAHLYAPVPAGPFTVDAEVLRGGRSAGVRTRLGEAATAVVRLARTPDTTLRWPPGPAAVSEVDPESLPPLEIPVDFVPFSQYLDIRPINSARPFAGGETPEFDVWIRLTADIDFAPQELAAVLLDALPPGLYATRTAPVPIPTIEFSAHFPPAAPASRWYRLRHRTVWATDDLCVDEAELHTATGELAGQARQLRRILGGTTTKEQS
ncbi:thioesterase family protein [Rhodococcus maanshanensis]|uniref:Acyl-CoA thioesterase n=1 Tax=Rhodococcus maanshanensis TaxID=183556 RepID=A0A1H7RKQ4_9NOCA|nr:thioesterase family protein [Rhodococcus maanshanensis]SEL60434.1 Acyl-CoA thioesterase [Rhodococcus maanshanensis]